jgi:hypothetical protein
MVSKSGIADQVLNGFDGVSEPEFDALGFWLPIPANDIALDFDDLAFPFGFNWETVNHFQELVAARKTQSSSIFGLTLRVTCRGLRGFVSLIAYFGSYLFTHNIKFKEFVCSHLSDML